MASGHPTLSTFHAGDISTTLKRLTSPPIELAPTLLESLDVVVSLVFAKEIAKTARRVREVTEIISVDPRTGEVMSNVVFRWDPLRDAFDKVAESEKLKNIAARIGASVEEVLKEVERRAEFLRWMLKTGKKDYLEVTRLINFYYKDPAKALEMMKEKVPEKVEVAPPVEKRRSLLELLGFRIVKEKSQ